MIELAPGFFVPLTALAALTTLVLIADALWLFLSPNRRAAVLLAVLLALIVVEVACYPIGSIFYAIGQY